MLSPSGRTLLVEGHQVYTGFVQHWDVVMGYGWPKGPIQSTFSVLDTESHRILRQWNAAPAWRYRFDDDRSLTLYNYSSRAYSDNPALTKCTLRIFKGPGWQQLAKIGADIVFADPKDNAVLERAASIVNKSGLRVPFTQSGDTRFNAHSLMSVLDGGRTLVVFATPEEPERPFKIGEGEIFVLQASRGYTPEPILSATGCHAFYAGAGFLALSYYPVGSPMQRRIRIWRTDRFETVWDGLGDELAAIGVPGFPEEVSRNVR